MRAAHKNQTRTSHPLWFFILGSLLVIRLYITQAAASEGESEREAKLPRNEWSQANWIECKLLIHAITCIDAHILALKSTITHTVDHE